ENHVVGSLWTKEDVQKDDPGYSPSLYLCLLYHYQHRSSGIHHRWAHWRSPHVRPLHRLVLPAGDESLRIFGPPGTDRLRGFLGEKEYYQSAAAQRKGAQWLAGIGCKPDSDH